MERTNDIFFLIKKIPFLDFKLNSLFRLSFNENTKSNDVYFMFNKEETCLNGYLADLILSYIDNREYFRPVTKLDLDKNKRYYLSTTFVGNKTKSNAIVGYSSCYVERSGTKYVFKDENNANIDFILSTSEAKKLISEYEIRYYWFISSEGKVARDYYFLKNNANKDYNREIRKDFRLRIFNFFTSKEEATEKLKRLIRMVYDD